MPAWPLQDAKASLHIKHHRNCLEADRMRRTRASAAAGAINLKQRCGQCKTCMNNYAGVGPIHLLGKPWDAGY